MIKAVHQVFSYSFENDRKEIENFSKLAGLGQRIMKQDDKG